MSEVATAGVTRTEAPSGERSLEMRPLGLAEILAPMEEYLQGEMLDAGRGPGLEFLHRWIAACAVYPVIRWPLTQALGRALARAESKPPPDEFLHLVLGRLAWFREGRMPLLLRQPLAEGLSAADREIVRNTVTRYMLEALEGPGGRLNHPSQLAKAGRDLARLGERAARHNIHSDAVLRTVLSGRVPTVQNVTRADRRLAAGGLDRGIRQAGPVFAALLLAGGTVLALEAVRPKTVQLDSPNRAAPPNNAKRLVDQRPRRKTPLPAPSTTPIDVKPSDSAPGPVQLAAARAIGERIFQQLRDCSYGDGFRPPDEFSVEDVRQAVARADTRKLQEYEDSAPCQAIAEERAISEQERDSEALSQGERSAIIYYDAGGRLSEEDSYRLNQLAEFARDQKANDVTITGYSDNLVPRLSVLQSKRAAETVAKAFYKVGLSPSVVAAGSKKREVPMKSGESQPLNRRVEVVIRIPKPDKAPPAAK